MVWQFLMQLEKRAFPCLACVLLGRMHIVLGDLLRGFLSLKLRQGFFSFGEGWEVIVCSCPHVFFRANLCLELTCDQGML